MFVGLCGFSLSLWVLSGHTTAQAEDIARFFISAPTVIVAAYPWRCAWPQRAPFGRMAGLRRAGLYLVVCSPVLCRLWPVGESLGDSPHFSAARNSRASNVSHGEPIGLVEGNQSNRSSSDASALVRAPKRQPVTDRRCAIPMVAASFDLPRCGMEPAVALER